MSSCHNPANIAVDTLGRPIAVSSSQVIVNGFQPAIPVAGRDYRNTAHILRTNEHSEIINTPNEYFSTRFGQQRTSRPFTLFEGTNVNGYESINYSTRSVGVNSNVTAQLSASSIKLTCGTGSNDYVTLRTNEYFRYNAGKEVIVKTTVSSETDGLANQIVIWGLGDDNDGIFYCISQSNFGMLRRTSTTGVVREFFISASLFEVDKLDGTGASYQILNRKFGQIYETHLQWLGYGLVDLFVNGHFVHSQSFFNTNNKPYMRTATLPLTWEIRNIGATTQTSSLTYTCSTVESENGNHGVGPTFSAFNNVDMTTNNTTGVGLLAIRPGTTFRGAPNRLRVVPCLSNISNESGRTSFRVILNPTFTGTPNWQSASLGNSCVEYASSSLTWTGGETISAGLMPNTTGERELDLERLFEHSGRTLKLNAFGTSSDVLMIVAKAETGVSTIARCMMNWHEYYN